MTFFKYKHTLLTTFYDHYYTKQLHSFFSWVKTINLNPDDRIFIDLPSHNYLCDRAQKKKSLVAEGKMQKFKESTVFILCAQNSFCNSLEKLGQKELGAWKNIFQSPILEVWEHTARFALEKKPLRLGLSLKEKSLLLGLARETLLHHLDPSNIKKVHQNTFPAHLSALATVDVALWVDGELRGSIILEQKPLIEAVPQAALYAAIDARFKPLSLHELDRTRIEIAIMSDLCIPLQYNEIEKNEIYSKKGYLMYADQKKGWFVPAVFNCLTFLSLADMTKTLREQKIAAAEETAKTSLYIFEVENFIESPSRNPLLLTGPRIVKNEVADIEIISKAQEIAQLGVEYLSRIQEPDGNIPPVISVLTGKESQIDWLRLAHTVWALALFGKTTNNSVATSVAENGYSYLKKYAYSGKYPQPPISVYFHRAAHIFNDTAAIQKSLTEIISLTSSLSYEPLFYSQAISCLLESTNDNQILFQKCIDMVGYMQVDFAQKLSERTFINLTAYADLMLLLYTLGEKTNNNAYHVESQKIANWYLAQQLPDGAFPSFTTSSFTYTRGTGKIFESLSGLPYLNDHSVAKVLSWFNTMQYTNENTYFIKNEITQRILGGFRHDDVNQDVWIDSTSHFLIAVSRLLSIRKE